MNIPASHLARFGIAAVLATASVSVALARPDTRQMTCSQTQRLIVNSGAIVLTTGAHTYDRYVAAERYCSYPEVPTQTWVRTRDHPQCPVFNCQYYEPPILFDD
jgi:hypothetical protein